MSPPIPVTYDDRKVIFSTDLFFAAPGVVNAGGGVQVENQSDGTRYQAGLSVTGVPGVTPYGVGPSVGVGGTSLSLFFGPSGLNPRVGVGEVFLSPQAGLCAGYWCTGPGGASLLPPPAMGILAGLQAVTTIVGTEREDVDAIPVMLANQIVSGFVPIAQVIETGHALGLGNDEEDSKGFPSSRIEKNIRGAVDRADSFRARYDGWIKGTGGTTPTPTGIEAYRADLLYLAKKLHFLYEEKYEKGRLVFQIVRSTPFQIRDPELAVRFLELLARVFSDLAREDSGLNRYLTQRSEELAQSLGRAAEERPLRADPLLSAEAAFHDHLAWIQTMGLLYSEGFFHRRRDYLQSVVIEKDGENGRRFRDRLDRLENPEMGRFQATLVRLGSVEAFPPERYARLRGGVEAIRATRRIGEEDFPGWEGDGTLLFDRERARRWARRLEIIDAVYRLGEAKREVWFSRPLPAKILPMVQESERELVQLIQAYPAEAVREWDRYGGGLPASLRENVAYRLEKAAEDLKDLDLKGLPVLVRPLLIRLAGEARRFRVDRFRDYRELFQAEEKETALLRAGIESFQGLFSRYEALRADLWPPPSVDEIEKMERVGHSLQAVSHELEMARVDYERFNTRRVGRYFLKPLLDRAGIDPTRPPDDPSLF